MKSKITDVEVLRSLSPSDLASWMRTRGWQRHDQGEARFVKIVDGESVEIDLPQRVKLRDYPLRVAELLDVLEAVEQQAQEEILQEIRAVQAAFATERTLDMSYQARVLKDSMSPDHVRLVTVEVTFPRIVLAEFNTHRMFSRNSASSRAIPIKKMLKMVVENPYVPERWGKNQKGMQAYQELLPEEAVEAEKEWLKARDLAVQQVERLLEIGVHKQITNRLLEPFMWHTVICTATEWSNFFHLRNHEAAHPAIQRPAKLIIDAIEDSEPESVSIDAWHMPLIFDEDWELVKPLLPRDGTEIVDMLVKISCARCARVSYLTHDGKRDLSKDLELYDRLLGPGHMSPFEHAARPMNDSDIVRIYPYRQSAYAEKMAELRSKTFCGNFRGWVQHRKQIAGESDLLGYRSNEKSV